MWTLRLAFVCGVTILSLCFGWPAHGTDVFYPDKSAVSSNGLYKVEAKSPDNRWGPFKKPFQSNFVYTLTDVSKRRVLWKRKQQETEDSCGSLFVDNDGWIVILTGESGLIFVSPSGNDTGELNILSDALTKTERERYVQDTTAGPMWMGYSHLYLLHTGEQRLFVINPWWNRRIIADVAKGELIQETAQISKACRAAESDYVMRELESAVRTSGNQKEEDECCEAMWPALKSVYLAGKIGLKDAVPLIRKLESSRFSGHSASGGDMPAREDVGEIDPRDYSAFTLRQVAQLSLRRLGEIPQQLPANEFTVLYQDNRKNHRFQNPPLPYPRHTRASAVKIGMRAEDVLATVGSPDFVKHQSWEYDMDAKPPYTLVLLWDSKRVKRIEKKPALWKDGKTRDEYLAY